MDRDEQKPWDNEEQENEEESQEEWIRKRQQWALEVGNELESDVAMYEAEKKRHDKEPGSNRR